MAFRQVNGEYMFDLNHHRHRHHKEGVEEVREKWGDKAATAAALHIIYDIGKVPYKCYYKGRKERFMDPKEIFG